MVAKLPAPSLQKREFGAVPALTDEDLFTATGVRIAFTGRAGGVSPEPYDSLNLGVYVGDDFENVQRNRAIVLDALGVGQVPLVVPKQVHETNIVSVGSVEDAPRAAHEADEGCDGVVVQVPGVAAQLSFADCLPLIIVSPTGRFAVLHAGWRGALAGIAGIGARALARADKDAGQPTDPRDFNAYIGAYIHSECFEAGDDVVARFVERYTYDVIDQTGNVNLARVVRADMAAAGMDEARIVDSGICTVCNDREYYSFRAAPDGVTGRHGAWAVRIAR